MKNAKLKLLIIFFTGTLLVISGNDAGALTGVDFLSIVCNFIGVILLAYSVKCYTDYTKYDERYVEICFGINEISTELQEIRKQLCHQSEISETLKHVTDMTADEVDQMIRTGKNLEKLLQYSEEELKNNKEMATQLVKQNEVSKELKKNTEINFDIITDKVDKLIKLIEKFEKLPYILIEGTDKLGEKILEYVDNETELLNQLSQDIMDEQKKILKNFKNTSTYIAASIEESNAELLSHMKTLGQQYMEFEKVTDEIIKQLTLMSQKDYEIIKDLMDE